MFGFVASVDLAHSHPIDGHMQGPWRGIHSHPVVGEVLWGSNNFCASLTIWQVTQVRGGMFFVKLYCVMEWQAQCAENVLLLANDWIHHRIRRAMKAYCPVSGASLSEAYGWIWKVTGWQQNGCPRKLLSIWRQWCAIVCFILQIVCSRYKSCNMLVLPMDRESSLFDDCSTNAYGNVQLKKYALYQHRVKKKIGRYHRRRREQREQWTMVKLNRRWCKLLNPVNKGIHMHGVRVRGH